MRIKQSPQKKNTAIGGAKFAPKSLCKKRDCLVQGESIFVIEMLKKIIPRPDDLYRHLWVKCSSHERTVLDSYEKFLKLAAQNLDIEYVKTEEPFRVIKRRTLLASRHVHKKYRVQYELRSYFRNLMFRNLTGSTADTFLEYVERNAPEGVLLIIEKHKLGEIPFDMTEENKAK